MAGKSWQASHEPPRQAGGPPSSALAGSEKRGAHGWGGQSPEKNAQIRRHPVTGKLVTKTIPVRQVVQLLKGWFPQVCAHITSKHHSTSDSLS